jgi:hypothetical protein
MFIFLHVAAIFSDVALLITLSVASVVEKILNLEVLQVSNKRFPKSKALSFLSLATSVGGTILIDLVFSFGAVAMLPFFDLQEDINNNKQINSTFFMVIFLKTNGKNNFKI